MTTDGKRRVDFSSGVLKDRANGKRYPNSITALFRGIVRFWHSNDDGGNAPQKPLSPKKFLEQSSFMGAYFNTLERYPGATNAHGKSAGKDREKEISSLTRMLQAFGADKKTTAVEYFHIRAFGEYLGISESALLVAAKLCSIERRASDSSEFQSAALQFVEAERRFLDAAEKLIMDDNHEGFTHVAGKDKNSDRPIWIADVAALRTMVDKFNEGDLSVFRSLMERD